MFLLSPLHSADSKNGRGGVGSTNNLTRREAFARQRHDLIATFCNVSHNDAILRYEKRHRRRENSVLSRQFPAFLKDEGKSDSVMRRFLFVLLGITASDHDDCKPVVGMLAMQSYQLGCQLVTRAALRVRKHQKHLSPAELLERDGLTMEIGQIETRRRSAGFETFALDAAFTERKLSKCGLLRLPAICGFPRESHHLGDPCSQRLRHVPLLVQQICRRCAAVFEHFLA